jgi:hypothetical protein
MHDMQDAGTWVVEGRCPHRGMLLQAVAKDQQVAMAYASSPAPPSITVVGNLATQSSSLSSSRSVMVVRRGSRGMRKAAARSLCACFCCLQHQIRVNWMCFGPGCGARCLPIKHFHRTAAAPQLLGYGGSQLRCCLRFIVYRSSPCISGL